MMRDSSVIPIGGPLYTPRYSLSISSVSPSSSSSSCSPCSPTSPCYSPTSEHSSSSSSSYNDAQQLQYARSMSSYTASMWQRERLAIEKAKLDGTWKGDMTSRTNGSAKPIPGDEQVESNSNSSKVDAKRDSRGRARSIKRDLPASSPTVTNAERRWWTWRRS